MGSSPSGPGPAWEISQAPNYLGSHLDSQVRKMWVRRSHQPSSGAARESQPLSTDADKQGTPGALSGDDGTATTAGSDDAAPGGSGDNPNSEGPMAPQGRTGFLAHIAPRTHLSLGSLVGHGTRTEVRRGLTEDVPIPGGILLPCHTHRSPWGTSAGQEEGVAQFWSGSGLQKHRVARQPLGGAAGRGRRVSRVPWGPLLWGAKLWEPRSGSQQPLVSTLCAREASSTYPVVQAILSMSWERVRFGIGES